MSLFGSNALALRTNTTQIQKRDNLAPLSDVRPFQYQKNSTKCTQLSQTCTLNESYNILTVYVPCQRTILALSS